MAGVFISYRREDSGGYAGRLFDILSAEFGRENTFMDVDAIEGGDNFASVIHQKISASDVLLAVLGPRWLMEKEQNGTRRLDNPRDFVRVEISEALQCGIRIIPVLVATAVMPLASDLPENLRPLCERQAIELRDSHFHEDAQQLTGILHASLHGAKPQTDLNGKWRATVKYDWGATYNEVFQFEQDGEELSGTAGLLGTERTIRDGKITGNRIRFITRTFTVLGSDQSEETHSYKGTVESGSIQFTMLTDSRVVEHAPVHFSAIKDP